MNQPKRGELLKQSAFIQDPVKRLQVMLQHGLISDAEKVLRAMIRETSPVYFQNTERCVHAPQIGEFVSGDEFKVCLGRADYDGLANHPKCVFDHEGLRRVMGWTEAQRDTFMTEVIRHAITTVDPSNLRLNIASWAGSWEINATVLAMERFIPKGHELRQDVERWCLRAWFLDGAYVSCYFDEETQERYLGRKINRNRFRLGDWRLLEDDLRREQELAEAVIARLQELGMSEKEVLEDCYTWLDRHVEHLNQSLLVGVANASVFGWRDERRAAIMAREVKRVMDGRSFSHPLIVARLIDGGMLDASTDACALYRKYAVERLAEGRIGVVAEITAMIGRRFFGESGAWGPKPKLQFDLKECAARAFDIAWQKGEYGIAAALVFQFGEDACLDPELLRERVAGLIVKDDDGEDADAKLAELIKECRAQINMASGLAKTTGKQIRLDYSTEFTPKL